MRLAAGLLVALSATAGADVRVDWAAGRVTATGVGLADRNAPSPAVARGPARRKADDAAKAALAKALPALPLADGGTLATKLGDAAVKARLDRAIGASLPVDAELETDGSWRVTLAVPIEAVRQALTGPRALAAGGDPAPEVAPPIVIVDGVSAKPAVGFTVGGLAAPTIWVDRVPAWARGAPRVKATGATGGAIAVDAGEATAATLFVILQPR